MIKRLIFIIHILSITLTLNAQSAWIINKGDSLCWQPFQDMTITFEKDPAGFFWQTIQTNSLNDVRIPINLGDSIRFVDTPFLQVENNIFVVKNEGNRHFEVRLKTNITDWSNIICKPQVDWLRLEDINAILFPVVTYTFAYEGNYTGSNRSGLITFCHEQFCLCDSVSVESIGEAVSLEVSPKEFSLTNDRSPREFKVTLSSNFDKVLSDAKLAIIGNEEGWLMLSDTTSEGSTRRYTFAYDLNYSGSNRAAKIVFQNDEYSVSDTVLVESIGESIVDYWKDKKILWLGTSIPWGQSSEDEPGTHRVEHPYPQQVCAALGATLIDSTHGGLAQMATFNQEHSMWVPKDYGSTCLTRQECIGAWNAGLARDLFSQYSYENTLLGKDADLYVFDVEPNNVAEGSAEDLELFDWRLWKYTDNSSFASHRDTYIGALIYEIDQLLTEKPNAIIVFVGEYLKMKLDNYNQPYDVRTQSLALCEKFHIHYINLAEKLFYVGKNASIWVNDDMVHPKRAAYDRMAKMLANEMLHVAKHCIEDNKEDLSDNYFIVDSNDKTNQWKGKKILWFGPSLLRSQDVEEETNEQSKTDRYPQQVCNALDASLIDNTYDVFTQMAAYDLEKGIWFPRTFSVDGKDYTGSTSLTVQECRDAYNMGLTGEDCSRFSYENTLLGKDADLYVFDVEPNNIADGSAEDLELFDWRLWKYTDNSSFASHRDTYNGALIYEIDQLLTEKTNAVIVFVGNTPIVHNNNDTSNDVSIKTEALCEKFHIRYINLEKKLFNEAPFNKIVEMLTNELLLID